ncbi:deleted in malignant brain tumors 1 -like [Pelobates cultripes]|uniref:Deleted in malignant brain tumors 1 -like n=1 Tax=Pelobates cultripes TaxID=61616 RepID=A0AAD1S7B5_PELCU|nr:deleted in malignant brain tumors 1 -like [Pelobates cultripes]
MKSNYDKLKRTTLKDLLESRGLSKVTLVGGHSTCSGKVMVQHNGTSSAVCADDWSMPNDVVVCRDVGCGPAIESIEHRKVIKQPKVNIQRLYCSGNEQNLSQCAAVLSNDYKCDTDAANVLCSQSVISNVRLVNGSSSCSGRVEVYFKEMWGTVCDQHWDLHGASVVCKQVGCGTVLEAPGGAYFGAGSGPVWLDKVFCNGSESVLAQCGLLTTRRTQCAHTRDAGVVCAGKKELQP